MKKLFTMLLVVVMIFSLVACSGTETNNSESNQETIEVTLDNWKDYFELRVAVEEEMNDFDELEKIYPATYFILKEEFENNIIEMDIAVEYSCKEPFYQEFSYNVETGEMSEGQVIEGSLGEPEVNETFTLTFSNDFSWGDVYMDYGHKIVQGFEGGSFSLDGNIASVNRKMYTNVDIVRVQGTLTLVK